MIVAKLIGESVGSIWSRQYRRLSRSLPAPVDRRNRPAQRLAPIALHGPHPQIRGFLRGRPTPENRQKNEKRDAHFFLSRLGITNKKGDL
jgi:hypothetical protein